MSEQTSAILRSTRVPRLLSPMFSAQLRSLLVLYATIDCRLGYQV